MRLGLIVRAVTRGLGIQSLEAWRHLNPAVTVLIDSIPDHGRWKLHPEWYPDAIVTPWAGYTAPISFEALDALLTCDVILTFETWYDPGIPELAKAAGIGTVIMVNPELWREHETKDASAVWVATAWRREFIPRAEHVPFPVALDRLPFNPGDKYLHLGGHKARLDRNGMEAAIRAARYANIPMTVTTQDRMRLDGRGIQLMTEKENYWEMYEGFGVLVMPRKYGGLCMVEGTKVKTPTGLERIENLRPGDQVMDDQGPTLVTDMASRTVQESVEVNVRGRLLKTSADHLHLVADRPDGELREVKAAEVKVGDWMKVVRPDSGGIRKVHVGPKPVVKALAKWWEEVEIDRDWARVMGLWLAEGHAGIYQRAGRNRGQATVAWSFGPGERYLAEEVVQILASKGVHATMRLAKGSEGTYGPSQTWQVRCRTLWLYEFFQAAGLGRGSYGKRAPDLPADLAGSLIGGWLDGDGSITNGGISGWSQSIELVSDMWRLMAKNDVLGSITHSGHRLDVMARPDVFTVADWCRRLKNVRVYERPPRATMRWRPLADGWMVKVGSVTYFDEPMDVVAIETQSGRYVAEDVLTHNCLPVQEAMAAGLAVIMSDTAPNADWPVALVKARRTQRSTMVGGVIDIYETDKLALAEEMTRMLDLDYRREFQERGRAWAEAHSWGQLKAEWLARLAELC